MILLLLIGLCGLAVHLATESFSISYQSSTNTLAESAEHCDDQLFLIPCQTLEENDLLVIPMPAVFLPRASISLAPKLPQRNF
jgi:hypothetical protein